MASISSNTFLATVSWECFQSTTVEVKLEHRFDKNTVHCRLLKEVHHQLQHGRLRERTDVMSRTVPLTHSGMSHFKLFQLLYLAKACIPLISTQLELRHKMKRTSITFLKGLNRLIVLESRASGETNRSVIFIHLQKKD